MPAGYPILLDLSGRRVLIIGGGAVAARKAAGVLAAGCDQVICVAPRVCDAMPAAVRRVAEPFGPHHLEGAGLVFAATDSAEVNAAVVAEARRRGVWVNCAAEASPRGGENGTEGRAGDFTVPAVSRAGELTLAVSAGAAPALAAAVRDDLAQKLDPRWVKLAAAMSELRRRARDQIEDAAERQKVLRRLASLEAAEVLAREGVEGLWRWSTGR